MFTNYRTATEQIYQSLKENLRNNNVYGFWNIISTQGLPQDNNWYDYNLLIKAIRFNRKSMANILLDNRCRVNKPQDLSANTATPLHLVAEKLGWCTIVRKMLRLNARVPDVDADGNTPLHIAFLHGNSDYVIDSLLESYMAETIVDILNSDGLGIMHIACTRSNYRHLKTLLEVGHADIYSRVLADSSCKYAGFAPLHFAVVTSKHDIAKYLCENDADVYAQDCTRTTPLHLALLRGDSKMIDILFYYDSQNANYVNDFGVTHFMAACVATDSNMAEQYIEMVTVNPLLTVNSLINRSVMDIPNFAFGGYTPLHFACEFGRYRQVEKLISIGSGHHCLTQATNTLTPRNCARKEDHDNICALIDRYMYDNGYILAAHLRSQQRNVHRR